MTTTIARTDLIAAAQQAAENLYTLNLEALRLYIAEAAEALPEAVPVTTTSRELEKMLLNGADSWDHYCRGGCPAIVATFEILVRHHGEAIAEKLVGADDAGERAIAEQAKFLATAAERLRLAFKQLARAVNTAEEEGLRKLKTLAEEGLKRIGLLCIGHHTIAGGVVYRHYRALYAEGRSVRDCTDAVTAALGLKTTEGGDISMGGSISVADEVEKHLALVLPGLKVSSELVW